MYPIALVFVLRECFVLFDVVFSSWSDVVQLCYFRVVWEWCSDLHKERGRERLLFFIKLLAKDYLRN